MKFMYIAIVVLALTAPMAFAQGSGSSDENPASSDDFHVTRSFEGKVLQVKMENSVIVIENKDGERHDFHFTDQTEITSSKGSSGSESLKVSALKPGKRVKVVFRPSDMYADRVRILD